VTIAVSDLRTQAGLLGRCDPTQLKREARTTTETNLSLQRVDKFDKFRDSGKLNGRRPCSAWTEWGAAWHPHRFSSSPLHQMEGKEPGSGEIQATIFPGFELQSPSSRPSPRSGGERELFSFGVAVEWRRIECRRLVCV